MPAVGRLGRTRSLRREREESALRGSTDLVSPKDTRHEVPYEWRRMASPPISGGVARFHQLVSPDAQNSPGPKQQGSYFFRSPGSSISYGSLDTELIGFACGGPHESPLPPLPPEHGLPRQTGNCGSPGSISTAEIRRSRSASDAKLDKSRRTKWRSLGGLLGKKNASPPGEAPIQSPPSSSDEDFEQDHQRQPTRERLRSTEDSSALSPGSSASSSQQIKSSQIRSPTDELRPRKRLIRKDSIIRAYGRSVKAAARPTKPGSLRSQMCSTAEQRDHSPIPLPTDVEVKSSVAALPTSGGSLLQVEIPSIQLERYSVMFENVLKRPPPSSLLARRHGRLEDLRAIHENDQQVSHALVKPWFSADSQSEWRRILLQEHRKSGCHSDRDPCPQRGRRPSCSLHQPPHQPARLGLKVCARHEPRFIGHQRLLL